MEPVIHSVEIITSDFSPKLHNAYLFSPDMTQPKGKKLEYRMVYDYEFELILDSHGAMYVNDVEYPLKKGDIVFRRPGETTQGVLPYKCYALIFNFNDTKYINDTTSNIITVYKNPILNTIPLIFNTSYLEKYIPLFNLIMEEHINPSITSEIVFKINLLQIINMLYHEVTSSLEAASISTMGQYSYIRKALEYIKFNWNKPLTLDILSSVSGVSKNHFLKVFTKVMDLTPNDYITRIRINKAKQMLAMTNDPINIISINCGYDNIPYFSYLFKRKEGISPAEFRKKYSYY